MLRPQYYFRESSQGLLAWDVRRLANLTSEFSIQSMALSAIAEIDEDRWFRHGAAPTSCRSIVDHCLLILAADLSYPIILDQTGRVMDGMHRVCKALTQGVSHLSAVRFAVDPEPDYINVEPDALSYD